MAKRAWGCLLVAAGLWACSAADDGAADDGAADDGAPSDLARSQGAPAEEAAPAERDVTPVARFQFVSTPEGMAVETVSDGQVQTFSCPTRSCAGLCDECAARACQAAGELSGACAFLVSSCNDTCSCQGPEGNAASCGFPVCALDRMICYVGDETDEPGVGPDGPGDPSPFDSASRPNAGRPSESSSNASRPSF